MKDGKKQQKKSKFLQKPTTRGEKRTREKRAEKRERRANWAFQSFNFFQKCADNSVFASRTVRPEIYEIKVLEKIDQEELNPKERWHFSEIYSDSESDNEKMTRKSPTAAGPSSSIQSSPPFEINARNLCPDTYVLVEIRSEVTKKNYYYVGVCQNMVCEEEGEVLIMFMKMYGKSPKTLIMDEN